MDALGEAGLIDGAEFKTTGTHTVTVHYAWKYKIAFATSAGGSGQYGYASALVGVIAEVENETANTNAFVGSAIYGYDNGTTASTHSYSSKGTLSASLTFVKGDVYYVEVVFEIEVTAEASPGSSAASVTLNMGSSGKEGTISSILEP